MASSLDEQTSREDYMIGSEDIIVEIDESVMTITFIYYDLPLFPFIFKPKQIVVFYWG